ncbi:hypothetical protein N9E29_02180 [Porticoccaceae bacterium]|nr:hypothetical protein [Porticoccaceae bacterium]
MNPVAIFGFKRADHLEQTLNAILRHDGYSNRQYYIFLDNYKKKSDRVNVEEVRLMVESHPLKNKTIIARPRNLGLKDNIKSGLDFVLSTYDTVIVLEDDIVVGPLFFRYMDTCLESFAYDNSVFHINGWQYPVNLEEKLYFSSIMNCWGWATWRNRWVKYDDNYESYVDNWSFWKKIKFDLYFSGLFWNQIRLNKLGTLNTWAIFWFATIYENKGSCVSPHSSLVENIGFDSSGEHSKDVKNVYTRKLKTKQVDYKFITKPNDDFYFLKVRCFYIFNKNPKVFFKNILTNIYSIRTYFNI